MRGVNGPDGPPRTEANHSALSPLQFLERSASIFPDRVGIVHGGLRRTWAEVYQRCRRLSSALQSRGVQRGDVVAVMLSNTPEHIESHFGVPMCGAVLNPLNYRLDVRNITFMLIHAEAKVVIVDREFAESMAKAIAAMPEDKRPLVVDVDDPMYTESGGQLIGAMTYEQLLAEGDPNASWSLPPDEWDAISLCYTSGTTADPKGVLLHHRGAYINGLNNLVTWSMPRHSIYLWTLPMFHCNGWYFHYSITANAGTHVCLRKVVAADIFGAIIDHGVTHLCGAPIVMSTMLQYDGPRTWSQKVSMMTAASAPPAPILAKMQSFGIDVTHVYGLTEVYGPAVVCEWKSEWDALPIAEQAVLKARQGTRYVAMEYVDVVDPETKKPVPRDGTTIGEVVFRGNIVMKGYLKNPSATAKAFEGGMFNSGDLAVMHPDGYIQLKDRSKDIIISGGENISTLEVESLLLEHPKIAEVAVVARPDEKWGETPVAWIVCRPGEVLADQELFEWCRAKMPRYMVPRTFVFDSLERVKTSTGKVQKHVLRKEAQALTKQPMAITSADDRQKLSKL